LDGNEKVETGETGDQSKLEYKKADTDFKKASEA